jgi:hypothetical protein
VLIRTALTIFFALVPSLALAHGEAEWIQKSKEHGWCCGPKDCERVPKGAVILKGEIYIIPSTSQSFHFGGRPEDRIFPSIDMDYWWCKYPDGRVRCLFVPPMTW